MSPDKTPLLAISNLVKRFGGFRALDGLSLSIAPGEVLGLVGPNGSGKTTCINVISGLYAADGGDVLFESKSISGVKSHHLVHLGINRTFQVPKPFLSLTVRENIEVAIAYGNHPEGLTDAEPLLESLRLPRVPDPRGAELHRAQQKLHGLARALAIGASLRLVEDLARRLSPPEVAWD